MYDNIFKVAQPTSLAIIDEILGAMVLPRPGCVCLEEHVGSVRRSKNDLRVQPSHFAVTIALPWYVKPRVSNADIHIYQAS